ncbi:Calcineurin-like phosphoesterase [Beijerinckiaceae bacterium RH AL1]|nr:calcineurin-like phosphoesterase family protein [Beijerinckiaceae bacterium]VVB45839.1 Calcineurin-like phosphoesterase [Beijerinckiaceae bacterium RH CH11]VVB45916.1 Calcineurin-like phosphoesterase [Beijerinckiaceae bacterium RH AL8]VVC55067.1 Calcineurin-like phosphoesterase [Beijerinckiaceae bacterium RH AL1]
MTQGSTTEGPTRREIMLGGAALALASSATAQAQDQALPAAVTAAGTITEIVPGSAPGAKGPPLPNVLVSNGREVVRTGADGRYSLPVAPGQSIFVVKPAGFRLPIDAATYLVRYSYVYDPDGTPASLGFRYTGIAPTGPLPATIDFELTRVDEPARFDVLLMTDPQPETTAELEYVRDDVISGLFGTNAAFGMTLGDLMFDDLSLYHRYNRIVATLGLPWWNVGGNHDLDYEAPDGTRARDTWKRVFGAPYYAHEHANALFIMLDNVDYLGLNTGKEAGVRGAYRGRFSADQLTFVKNLLAETPQEKLIVLAFHIPLRTYLDPKDPANNTDNTGDLLALLGDRPSVSFCGHTHSTEHHYLGAEDGFPNRVAHHHHVLAAASGSWWSGPLDHRGIACADQWDGTPNGTHVLSIDGNAYTTRFVPAAEPAGSRMRISLQTQNHQSDREVMREVAMDPLLRSPITSDQADGTRVVVNVFDGGPRTSVSYALDDGHPIEMQRVAKVDPFVAQLYGRYPDTIKKWVTPQHCSHLFAARLPAGLRPGTYALKVAATDEYGRQLSNGMVLEVV